MNCEQARARLQDQFDRGAAAGEGVGVHIAACAECRRYRERLFALENCLEALPLVVVPADFAARVQDELVPPPRLHAIHAVAVLVVVAGVVALGWSYPVDLSALWRQWGLPVAVALADWHWSDAVAGLRLTPDALIAIVPSVPREPLPLSTGITWGAIAVAVCFLVVFNGIGLKWLSRREPGFGRVCPIGISLRSKGTGAG